MSKILLTGGTGYIASHTAISLIEAGYEVIAVDNLVNSSVDSIEKVEKYTEKHIPLYIGDVKDADLLDKIFNEHKIDAVIHFAGLKAVGESVGIPLKYYENNLNTTITLLDSMLKHNVNRIVFSSSATVYAPENPDKRVEGMPLGCTNPYGWTKFMCEQIIRDTAFANKQLDAICLRYFNPVGAHPKAGIGENPKGIPNNLMPYIQQVANGKLECLKIYGNDYDTVDGTGVRDYIHVCDLADAHKDAVKYLESHHGCLEINIGTGHGVSVLELVNAFEKANDIKLNYVFTDRRPGDVAANYADASKAKEVLGWSAKRNVEDMCRDAYNYAMSVKE